MVAKWEPPDAFCVCRKTELGPRPNERPFNKELRSSSVVLCELVNIADNRFERTPSRSVSVYHTETLLTSLTWSR